MTNLKSRDHIIIVLLFANFMHSNNFFIVLLFLLLLTWISLTMFIAGRFVINGVGIVLNIKINGLTFLLKH